MAQRCCIRPGRGARSRAAGACVISVHTTDAPRRSRTASGGQTARGEASEAKRGQVGSETGRADADGAHVGNHGRALDDRLQRREADCLALKTTVVQGLCRPSSERCTEFGEPRQSGAREQSEAARIRGAALSHRHACLDSLACARTRANAHHPKILAKMASTLGLTPLDRLPICTGCKAADAAI